MQQRHQLSALTGLRFFAALWVLVYHQSMSDGLLAPLLKMGPRFVFNMAQTGYAAVTLFFILSGFVLAYTYSDRATSVRDFWAARLARIYPLYLLGLLIIAPPILAKMALRQLPLGQQAAGGIASLFLLQAWHPSIVMTWNIPGWSLSVEAFFYLAFPFLLEPLRRLGRGGLIAGILLLASLSVGFALMPNLARLPDFTGVDATMRPAGLAYSVLKFNPLIRLPEFIIGMMLGRLFLIREARRAAGPASASTAATAGSVAPLCVYLGLASIILLAAVLAPRVPYLLFHNVALVPGSVLLIYGLACGGGDILTAFLSQRPLVALGEASYALYILHVAVADWMMRFDKPTFHLAAHHPTLLFSVYLLVCIAISIAANRFLEEPLRQYLRRRLSTLANQPVFSAFSASRR